jgi:hypothetical protein
MVLRRFIARLLAILVIAGLAVAPLATAKASGHAAMTDMASMSTESMSTESMSTESMSTDMPCCPEEKSGCPDCPLAAICVLKITPAAPALADAILMRLATKAGHTVSDDALSHGLDRPPPDHPPRILV